MKKTQKKIFGFFGLGVVVAMTSVALTLPNPGVSAVSSVTDTVIVVVRSDTPDVNIDGIDPGEVITDPSKSFEVDYSNVETIKVVLRYTNKGGYTQDFVLADGPVSGMPNPLPLNIDFSNPDYGYGDYVLTVTGEGSDGIKDIDIKEFSYEAFAARLKEDEEKGKTYVDLDYKPDDGTEAGEGNVARIELNVYDPDGNLVTELSPITVLAPQDSVEIPFDKYDLKPGMYTIKIVAYDRDGEPLFNRELSKKIEEDMPVPDTNAPDTGGLFKNIGVSQSDFLITGLIMFFVAGITGAFIIGKKNKNRR
ncbi:hypothetical protein IKG38_02240 [Candidatus Saccharibacteria bacterium]|nr:hypothetical protein [Candidatus Saccharibacteria bacterium]